MIVALGLLAAIAASSTAPADVDRSAIRHVVTEHHVSARLNSVVVHGQYAVASGRSSAGPFYDGLRLTHAGWRVTCSYKAPPTSNELVATCGFPIGMASELAASQSAQTAAQRGDFSTAFRLESRAYASASAPEREDERARVRLLQRLSDQMRTGEITRAQAIRTWNEFRLTWALP